VSNRTSRLIPTLELSGGSLIKTKNFRPFAHVGDPANSARIFNELEVDELIVVDTRRTRDRRNPPFAVIEELASECFMPLIYGGGVDSLRVASEVMRLGVEKIVVGSAAYENPILIRELVDLFGSQAVVSAVDYRGVGDERLRLCSDSGRHRERVGLFDWVETLEGLGAGELLLTSVDRQGTWEGLDLTTIASVTNRLGIPVVAHGGARSVAEARSVLDRGEASAVALGSVVAFQAKGKGVLVGLPEEE